MEYNWYGFPKEFARCTKYVSDDTFELYVTKDKNNKKWYGEVLKRIDSYLCSVIKMTKSNLTKKEAKLWAQKTFELELNKIKKQEDKAKELSFCMCSHCDP